MSICRLVALSVLVGTSFLSPLMAQTTAPVSANSQQKILFPLSLGRPASTNPADAPACVVAYGPPTPISALAFHPDGRMLAVGGYQEVLVWDLSDAKLARRIGVDQLIGPVRALQFLDKGKFLVVGEGIPGQSGTVKVFDFESGQPAHTFTEPKDVVCSLAVSPDGKLLVAGGADHGVYVWNWKDKKLLQTLKDHTDLVSAVAFSRDGKMLATASADKTTLMWEVGTWNKAVTLGEAEPVQGVAFGPDHNALAVAVAGPSEWAVRMRRKDNPRSIQAINTMTGMPQCVLWVTGNKKTNKLYVGCSDNTAKAFSPGGGQPMTTLRGHNDWVYVVAVSPDGNRLATGSADGTVRLWSENDGKWQATLVQLAPRSDRWLIMAGSGHFATSSPEAIKWETKGLSATPEKLMSVFKDEEAVRKTLAGKPVAPPTVK